MTVAIVDYGSGNLHSAAKAFERAARESGDTQPIVVTSSPDAVARADRIVLPGVGAFADCRRGLDAVAGMVEALNERVRKRGRPFLGICVGMQLMAERGREYEVTDGPRLDRRRGRQDRARRSGAEDSAHGLEHAQRDQAASAARRHRDRAAGPARLFRALLSSQGAETAPTWSRRRTMAGRSPPSSAATPSSARNSIRRRASGWGLRLIANFLKWKP